MAIGPLCDSRSQPSVLANGRRPIKKNWAVGVCTAAISLAGGAVSTTDNDVSSTDNDVWADRVHCALGERESMKVDADRITLRQAVAARVASRGSIRTIDSSKAANLNGITVSMKQWTVVDYSSLGVVRARRGVAARARGLRRCSSELAR